MLCVVCSVWCVVEVEVVNGCCGGGGGGVSGSCSLLLLLLFFFSWFSFPLAAVFRCLCSVIHGYELIAQLNPVCGNKQLRRPHQGSRGDSPLFNIAATSAINSDTVASTAAAAAETGAAATASAASAAAAAATARVNSAATVAICCSNYLCCCWCC